VGQGHYELPAEVAAVLEGQPRPLRVVDLGANIGVFGAHILRLYPDAEIIAFEPHPANVEVLRRCIQANRGGQGWQLVAACAGVEDGTVELSVDDEFTTARVDSSAPSTIAVPAVDVFPFLADLDFLKIDIEGSEWHLLEDARFRLVPARVVALEYHDFRCPEPDPRSLAQRRLEEAGYETAEASFEAPPGNGMLWGWRPSLPQ
jgi:FkbM family methyltransferase